MAKKPKGASVNVEVEGLKETLRACNALGKEANKELRQASLQIAKETASQAQSAASTGNRLQQAVAASITGKSDRVPKVVGGGTKKVTSRGTQAGSIFFGAEFGGSQPQFPSHRGQDGYFLWPTIRDRQHQDIAMYQRALNEVCDKWSRGG